MTDIFTSGSKAGSRLSCNVCAPRHASTGTISSIVDLDLLPNYTTCTFPFLLLRSERVCVPTPSLSLCWAEHQRDQAGLAYWKQMADQRQEGHSYMKRGSNMPGLCRGAYPWMMAVAVCVSVRAFGWDEWLCRLSLWRLGQQLPSRILSVYTAANLPIYCNAQRFQRDVGQGQVRQ